MFTLILYGLSLISVYILPCLNETVVLKNPYYTQENKPKVKYLHQYAVIFFHKQKEQIYETITSKNLPC